MRIRKIILIAFLTFLAYCILFVRPIQSQSQPTTLDDICPHWGVTQSGEIYLWSNMWTIYTIPEPSLPGIDAIDTSNSIWIDTADYGYFDVPEDETETVYAINLQTEYGKRKLYITAAPSTPETMYAYAFESIEASTDGNGDYYGVHPCAAFTVSADLINSLFAIVCGNPDYALQLAYWQLNNE